MAERRGRAAQSCDRASRGPSAAPARRRLLPTPVPSLPASGPTPLPVAYGYRPAPRPDFTPARLRSFAANPSGPPRSRPGGIEAAAAARAEPRSPGPAHLHVVLLVLAGPAVAGHPRRHQALRHRLRRLEGVGVCGGKGER